MFGSPLYRGKEAERQRKKRSRVVKGGKILTIRNKDRFRGSIGERFYGDSKSFGYRQARDDERNA